MKRNKHILVAPLNWGLGHATRCIPIINALLSQNYKVTIASDGDALRLLKKEFPKLSFVSLPSYKIEYAEKGKNFKRKLISNLPSIRKSIRSEHKELEKLIPALNIDGVISDNRLGLYTNQVPCVMISHQLQVLSGSTTKISTAIHKKYIERFNECWVPDFDGTFNLSGILGHPDKNLSIPTRYIGPLSRMKSKPEEIKYTATAVLSGPEPQRSMLEEIITKNFKKLNGQFLIVRGKPEEEKTITQTKPNIKVINFLTTRELEKVINQSGYIIARSGYTTIMDLAVMKKKAFFIPTPGQSEQEYLAALLKENKIAPFAVQDEFKTKDLSKMSVYPGFEQAIESSCLLDNFGLFERKREFRPHTKFAFNINFLLVRLNDMFNNREPQT